MPKHLKFDWVLPDQVFKDLDREALLLSVKQEMAIRLFQDGRISSGFAAKLLKITRREFLELLEKHGIPYYSYEDEELEKRLTAAEDLLNELELEDKN